MIIDAHSHILSLAADPGFTVDYGREGSLCIYRSMGRLPSHRMPTEEEWAASGLGSRGWPFIGPRESRRDHPGFDKIVLLAVSPQHLDGRLIGTVDTDGVLGVDGPPDPEKCNDYIAAAVRADPGHFIGFASVNPAFKGPAAAVAELQRAVSQLGLAGLKLYPMYQHWAANDRDLAFPIYRSAAELGIPVMIHQAGSTRIDARLELGRPALLDDIGREFRDLRVIIAHCGLPWVDEALFLLTKHPHFYAELSYLIATLTRRDLFLLLHRCEPAFVPLEKIFFGTDYPGFLYDPAKLRDKLITVNEEARGLALPPIPEQKLRGIMGTNFAAVLGLAGA
ncbi:MAG TPA: amidohydrolase family protein [Streptosporangiaceae bacterium]|nr:amidohydrolase family protein [Streptosporangiaceae bacterium]